MFYVINYYLFKKLYESNSKGYESSDQKIFYILYIFEKINIEGEKLIVLLEETIKKYKEDEKNIPDSRKLIQTKFKEFR